MPKPHIEKCWKEKLQLKENSQAGEHSCKHETTGYFYLDVGTFSSGCVATRRRNTLWQQNTFILCFFLKTLLDQKHCVVTTYKWNLNLKKHKAATYLHILLIGLSSGPLSFNVIVMGQFSLITEGLTNTHTHPHTHYNDINRQFRGLMSPVVSVHHTLLHESQSSAAAGDEVILHSVWSPLINADCSHVKWDGLCGVSEAPAARSDSSAVVKVKRSDREQQRLISLCSLYLLCCLLDNLIVTDQSVCTLSWGRTIWACDCVVAKWIWNWYRSPGLSKQ